ncbi:type II secretion system protein [Candidatus Peribacteria bacterium]|nr:type II secretion system protein [Candidatus Peribacteria bacterium]
MPQKRSPKTRALKRDAFTLIEILIVMAIVGILGSVTIMAVNPKKQFCEAQNAKRKSYVYEIKNGLFQYLIHEGEMLKEYETPDEGASEPKPVCAPGVNDSSCVDLSGLVPEYMAAVPKGISEPNPLWSEYRIIKTGFGQVISNPYDIEPCSDTTESASGNSHLACVDNACTEVLGFGVDQCSSDGNCTSTSHAECVGLSCVSVEGPGLNLCSIDVDCNVTHLACVGLTCATVMGGGGNGCSTDANCSLLQHLGCINNSCVVIPGPGVNQCVMNTNCTVASHLGCEANACTSVAGPGMNQCAVNGDCNPSHIACVGLTCAGVPGAGGNSCVTGTNCEEAASSAASSLISHGSSSAGSAGSSSSASGMGGASSCSSGSSASSGAADPCASPL